MTFHKVFSAGTSFYGVSNLEALAKDTHKFESRYLDTLVGPYDEDHKHLYEERSPINHTDQLDCALCIFQGSEDKVAKYYFVRSLSFFPGVIRSFYNIDN